MPMAITVQIAGSQFMTISAAITPTATFAPTARIAVRARYLRRCPRLYTAAPSARAVCEDIISTLIMTAFLPVAIAANAKTGRYVSNDGSQRANDGSQHRKGRSFCHC